MKLKTVPSYIATTLCQSILVKFRLLTVVALAVLAVAAARQANAAPHALKATYFQTSGGVNAAGCSGCLSAPVPLFAPLNIKCPGAIGATCTFYLHLETDDSLTVNDMGIFQFQVGNPVAAPNPGPSFGGPLAGGGNFIWDFSDPLSGIALPASHSYAVTATVTNTVANQVDTILVNLACDDNGVNNAGGCAATTFLANLEVGFYVP